MTLGIHMIVQLWNWLPEELKTTKQRITCTYVTEHLFVKKKNDKKTTITIVESTENVYHVKSQNLHFPHAS